MINDIVNFISGTSSYTGYTFDRIGLWTLLLVVATVLLWLVARKQLSGLGKTAKMDFIRKFSFEVFSDLTRDIFMLLDYDALHFQTSNINYSEDISPKEFPFFIIDEEIVKQLKIDPIKMRNILQRKVYSAFEIDDYLLGHFEDIGMFEKRGLLDIEDVYSVFDWYIEIYWKNDELQKYIKHQRETEEEGDDIYEDFEYIFRKCRSYEQYKNKREPKLFWRLKWKLFEE
jgi:hypothetical protein